MSPLGKGEGFFADQGRVFPMGPERIAANGKCLSCPHPAGCFGFGRKQHNAES